MFEVHEPRHCSGAPVCIHYGVPVLSDCRDFPHVRHPRHHLLRHYHEGTSFILIKISNFVSRIFTVIFKFASNSCKTFSLNFTILKNDSLLISLKTSLKLKKNSAYFGSYTLYTDPRCLVSKSPYLFVLMLFLMPFINVKTMSRTTWRGTCPASPKPR